MNVRTVFGVLAWMLSSSLDASEVSQLVAISADGDHITYLLSRVQRINVYANDNEGAMSVVSPDGYQEGEYQKIIFTSGTTKIGETEVSNVYVYPNPVTNTLYVNGVDEDETHLIIYDQNGKCICGEYGTEIDVSFLPKGYYFLEVDDHFVKFIKQ